MRWLVGKVGGQTDATDDFRIAEVVTAPVGTEHPDMLLLVFVLLRPIKVHFNVLQKVARFLSCRPHYPFAFNEVVV